MQSLAPSHYHNLPPFEELFQTGVPMLIYHKVGPRPSGVRLKGLYVTPSRFGLQMDELGASGFASVMPEEIAPTSSPSKRIVFTFDDGFRNVFEHTLEPLARNRFHAIQYLVPNYIGKLNEWDLRDGEVPEPLMDAFQVRDWLAAGHSIGSHTLSHPRLSRLTLRDAREEIYASKAKLEDLFNVPIEHFCFPYGDFNSAVRDLVVEAGYKTACTSDFGVNPPTADLFTLARIFVRYPSRSLKTLKARLFA